MDSVNLKQIRICVNKIDKIGCDRDRDENTTTSTTRTKKRKLTYLQRSPHLEPRPRPRPFAHKWHVAKSSTVYVYKLKDPRLCLHKIDNEWNKIQKQRSENRTIPSREKKHECLACGKLFKQKHHLLQHFQTHTKEKPFECKMCDKSFSRKDPLIQHIVRFHCYNEKEKSVQPS